MSVDTRWELADKIAVAISPPNPRRCRSALRFSQQGSLANGLAHWIALYPPNWAAVFDLLKGVAMAAGRPPNEDVRYEARITVRLHPQEKGLLIADARTAGVSMGELVRRQYFNRQIIADVDREMIEQLRKIGVGLIKHLHNETGGVHAAQTAAILSDVQAFIHQLQKKK